MNGENLQVNCLLLYETSEHWELISPDTRLGYLGNKKPHLVQVKLKTILFTFQIQTIVFKTNLFNELINHGKSNASYVKKGFTFFMCVWHNLFLAVLIIYKSLISIGKKSVNGLWLMFFGYEGERENITFGP